MNFIDVNGNSINISVIGFFSIPELNKEYVMYGMVDDNKENKYGNILLGEVLRLDDNIQVLGILSSEKDLVVAYYNELSKQIGGNDNE